MQKQFVCIRCKDQDKACTISPGGDRLPVICGWNKIAQMIKPEWLEVPEEEKTPVDFYN